MNFKFYFSFRSPSNCLFDLLRLWRRLLAVTSERNIRRFQSRKIPLFLPRTAAVFWSTVARHSSEALTFETAPSRAPATTSRIPSKRFQQKKLQQPDSLLNNSKKILRLPKRYWSLWSGFLFTFSIMLVSQYCKAPQTITIRTLNDEFLPNTVSERIVNVC